MRLILEKTFLSFCQNFAQLNIIILITFYLFQEKQKCSCKKKRIIRANQTVSMTCKTQTLMETMVSKNFAQLNIIILITFYLFQEK